MAIGTNDTIVKWGTQDQIDDGTTATVGTGAFSEASSVWTNDDDAPFAQFVLECQFDTSMPTVGSLDLYARPLNVQSTSDPGAPDTSNYNIYIGSFPIDFGAGADTNFFTVIPKAELPGFQTSQQYEFYFYNNGTSQTVGIDWNLWVTPFTYGPA